MWKVLDPFQRVFWSAVALFVLTLITKSSFSLGLVVAGALVSAGSFFFHWIIAYILYKKVPTEDQSSFLFFSFFLVLLCLIITAFEMPVPGENILYGSSKEFQEQEMRMQGFFMFCSSLLIALWCTWRTMKRGEIPS